MSQNPYATPYPQQYGQPHPAAYGTGVPPRTSAMAVLSLVCSLICCIPGLSVLGVLFGGLALLAIAMSGGRVKGVGLAIAGLIIGIVLSVVWIMIIIGVMQVAGMMNQMVEPAIKGIEARDRDAVHATLVSTAHGSVDENRIGDFRDIMSSEYGTFERMPDGLGELVTEFGTIMGDPQIGPATQAAQNKYGQNGVFPLPAKFDSGWQAIMVYMDSSGSGGTGAGGMPLLRDLGIVRSDGSIEWLVAGGSGGTFQIPQIPPLNLPDLNGEDGDAGGEEGEGELNGDPEPAPAPEQPRNRNRPPK